MGYKERGGVILRTNGAKKTGCMCRVQKLICCFCVISLTLCYPSIEADAFQLNGWKLSEPTQVRCHVSTSTQAYISGIYSFVSIWGAYCQEVKFVSVGSQGNISIEGNFGVHNGTYATCVHNGNDSHTITLYQLYTTASSVEQHETIVHEVGHALGLAHCETVNNQNSVMRALGFNNKPYPLSDDREGITYLYGE